MSKLAFLVGVLISFVGVRAADPVTLVRVPDGGIQPQVIVDAGGAAHLIYFKGEPGAGDVYYAKSTNGGATWSKGIRVNSEPGSVIATGSIRGAQLALGKNGRAHVSWMGSKKTAPGGDHMKAPMLYARLNDQGSAFEPQKNVIADAYGLDGGGSVAADEKGNVYVAWHGNPNRDGEQNRRVYLARSKDEGKTFAREEAVDDKAGACGCCGIRISADERGVFILYRSAESKSDRNMTLLVSSDAAAFKAAKVDAWSVQTCPMSSSAILSGGRNEFIAWETQRKVMFAAVDAKTGKLSATTTAPLLAGAQAGQQKHPVLAVSSKGEVLFAWTEGAGWNQGGAAAWQVYDPARKAVAAANGLKFGVPVWSFVAVFAKADGGFVVMY